VESAADEEVLNEVMKKYKKIPLKKPLFYVTSSSR
jgi:hypothetical protein